MLQIKDTMQKMQTNAQVTPVTTNYIRSTSSHKLIGHAGRPQILDLNKLSLLICISMESAH